MKLKVLIIGPEKIGKSVISNFLFNDMKESPQVYRPTVGFRILESERKIKHSVSGMEETVMVDFWDLSGNLKYENTWQVTQLDADGVIIVTNGDKTGQNQETEAWIKNFPKKMKMSPNQCIGLANHPSGVINDYTPFSLISVPFTHTSFETRSSSIGPTVDKFIGKLVEKKNAGVAN